MTNVFPIKPSMPTPAPRPKAHPDKNLMDFVAGWRLACLQSRTRWAQSEALSRFFTMDTDIEPVTPCALDEVAIRENFVVQSDPRTCAGAAAMLGMVLDILQERDRSPDSPLASGDVFTIIKTVQSRLEQNSQVRFKYPKRRAAF